jgi:hypothetical protein
MGNSIKDIYVDDYQAVVGDLLTRNRSILDITSKFISSASKVNRSVLKAVTHCGCITVDAKKQNFPDEVNYENMLGLMDTHLKGKLCENCRRNFENEVGDTLFYIAALCNILDISMYDVILKDKEALSTLGSYSLR